MSLYELKNEIERLPLNEQAILLDALWLRLNQEEVLSEAQKAELDRRLDLFKAGKIKTIASATAHEALREKYL